MKITYNWLKEYCDFRLPPEGLAEVLTGAGFVVAGMRATPDGDHGLEIEVTSNRPDCLGVIGIAREVAALTRNPLKLPPVRYNAGKKAVEVKVTVEEPELCPRYTARVIRGVKIGPSPAWLQQRLEAVGLRPINNVVDVTNYVLMEWSQPLHAFDLDRLGGKEIIVRWALSGERLVTIDGAKLDLNPEVLVIADERRPVALAWVMGGRDTEVDEGTCNVLLESARFGPATVRRMARRFGLKTESSYRFERGVDIEGVDLASRRATALILELAGGEAAKDSVDVKTKAGARCNVPLRLTRLNAILGTNLEEEAVRDTLCRLGFEIKGGKRGVLEVAVPSFRGDVAQEIDLIEETARVYGYNNIPTNTGLPIHVSPVGRQERVEERVRGLLAGWGFFEAVTYSIVEGSETGRAGLFPGGSPLRIRNPIRAGEDCLRQTLLGNLLRAKRHNQDHGVPRVRLYELSKVYLPEEGQKLPMEKTCLGLLYEEDLTVIKGQAGKDPFYALKGLLEGLLSALGAKGDICWEGLANPFFTGERSCKASLGGGPLAILGEVSGEIVKAYDLRDTPCLAEIDFDLLVEKTDMTSTFQSLPLYPPIDRDIAIVVDEGVTWAEIESCVREAGAKFLEKVEFFDLYRDRSGKQIPSGKKGIAFSVHFRAPDRTLRKEEADGAQGLIIESLSKALGAVLR
ncbi:MAG TPA: phenylalanine--tRNA ligase subunit beta [Candidatus Brocadiales bacterium]|nr:phenylalanine--tRNA ligase subunit beta [Candidatus Brocadiales bacterium]